MSKAVEEAGQKITELKSKLESSKAEKSQLDQELIQHKKDREAARGDLSTATSIREKEHAEFVETTGEDKANLDAMTAAVAALEKGMGKSFIQSNKESVKRLEKILQSSASVDDFQKSEILDLLQSKNPFGDYSAQSGEIVGILKAMKDEMDKDLGGAVSAEEATAAGFEELASAKKAEISAASAAIESKTVRAGELAVFVTTTADDIEDTTAEMTETEAFVANLAATCAAKKKEWAERQKMRAEEVSAISEAIKVLNDDDALDLFKKTLSLSQTSNSMGFLQKKSHGASVVLRARDVLRSVCRKGGVHSAEIALIQYSLKSKAIDFSKIIAQIDGMVKVLGEEQKNDDETKTFCDKELAKTDGKKSDTEEAIASSTAMIEEMTDQSATLKDEIASLQKEIKALDKAVAEATEQRKEEHEDSIVFLQENNMAVQLIEKAKNKLYKFYSPNLHKEEPKKELTDEEKILTNAGRDDLITSFMQVDDEDAAAPPPPPDTWGAYQKKEGKSNGVIALMDMLGKELTDGITEAEHEEKTAQKDYERLMSDSTASRSQMAESITSKEVAKADLDTKVESTKEKLTSQETELTNIKQYLASLHAECDFLVDNYDLRKAARENEVEGLKNAKSVLSGADLS
jgi:chromosome segregation ATPase